MLLPTLRRSSASRRRTLSLERLEERVVLSANMIQDLNSVLIDPNPVNLTPVGNDLYFIYANGNNTGLGKWDGSAFTPIDLGVSNPFPDVINYYYTTPQNLIAVGNTLYFLAWDGQATELWKCTGTTVTEIKIGSYANPAPANLTTVGNTLYFTAYSSGTNNDLWKYDGTTLTDVSQTASPYLQPTSLYAINDTLYGFTYASQAFQLFRYDGSAFSVLAAANFAQPSDLVSFKEQLYWSATDVNNKSLLWHYDGTTWFSISVPDANSQPFQDLTVSNGALYFGGIDTQNHGQAWKYDGTTFTEIVPGETGLLSAPEGLTPFSNGIYFMSRIGDYYKYQLYQYDDSATKLAPIGPGQYFDPSTFQVVNDNLYFSASSDRDSSLWRYDGVTATQVLAGGSFLYQPAGFTTIGNTLYFSAYQSSGIQIWSLALPTSAPESHLLTSSMASSSPSDFTEFKSKIYFTATDLTARTSTQLWSTDGTSSGTIPLGGPDNPSNLFVAGNYLYFTAPIAGGRRGLFKYDGSSLSQIEIPSQFSNFDMVVFDNNLYFIGENSQSATALWKFDGVNLTEIFTTSNFYGLANLTAGASALYFVSATPDEFLVYTFDIYKYDGITLSALPRAGDGLSMPTSLLADGNKVYFTTQYPDPAFWMYDGVTTTRFPIPEGYHNAANLTLVGSTLFYSATSDNTFTSTLFEYNGTVSTPVSNITNSYFLELTAVGTDLYMAAYDASDVLQLWYVTGGVAHEIQVGTRFTPLTPTNLTAAGNLLYFTTTTQVDPYTSNVQLWVSSGGSDPLLVSVNPNGSSDAANLVGIGSNLYLSASDGVHGDEPWIVTPERAAPTVTLSAAALPANSTSLTITGTGFDANPAHDAVSFTGGVTGTIVSATPTELIIGNLAGLTAGTNLSVIVTVNGLASGAAVQVATVTAADLTNGSISGVVFLDSNVSGVLNPGETGVGGQTVYFDQNNNGVLDPGEPTALTVNGVYRFTNLAAGTYTVREVLLGGAILTAPASGSFTVTLAAGDQASNQNFGNVLTSIVVPVQLPPASAFPAKGNANADYVVALYRNLLSRNGDAGGLAYWTALLNTSAATRLQVVQGINGSVEHYEKEIETFYETIFGRAADPVGRGYWQQQLQQGIAEEAVVSAMLLTPEFLNKGDKNFVEFLYTSFLGRPPEEQGEAYWLNELGDDSTGMHVRQPNIGRESLIYNFVYSTEHVDRLVQGLYQAYLQRLPEFSALSAQAGSLLSYYYYPSTPFRSVAESVLSSDEFFAKAAANG